MADADLAQLTFEGLHIEWFFFARFSLDGVFQSFMQYKSLWPSTLMCLAANWIYWQDDDMLEAPRVFVEVVASFPACFLCGKSNAVSGATHRYLKFSGNTPARQKLRDRIYVIMDSFDPSEAAAEVGALGVR